ncbi:MAG: isoprenylcysteine carboxylmethyltransferase family protein [Pseudomonadota bacterium]
MTRAVNMVIAITCYTIFFATFLYLVAFVGNLPWVPVAVDRGPHTSPAIAAAIDLGLIAAFGLQHSVMARPAFKARWTKIVPHALERSVYVLAASLMLILLFALWCPLPGTLWSLSGVAAIILWALFLIGWLIVLLSTFLLNHFELFGLKQAWTTLTASNAPAPEFRTPFFYRLVRHPLYLGFFIAFWATPDMTYSHLLLAAGMSAFMLVAIPIEEGDLVDTFGDRYRDYQQRVGRLLPKLGR